MSTTWDIKTLRLVPAQREECAATMRSRACARCVCGTVLARHNEQGSCDAGKGAPAAGLPFFIPASCVCHAVGRGVA
jgi:ribosomal protein S27AE